MANNIADMKQLLVILLLMLSARTVIAQDDGGDDDVDYIQIQIDSLLSLIEPSTPDSVKVMLYYKVGVLADNSDTAMKYASMSLKLCKNTDYLHIADNYYNIGVSYYMQDKAREALSNFFKSTEILEKVDSKKKVADNAIGIGKCYHDLNLHDSSLFYLGRALELYTELKDTANITYSYNSIGMVNFDLSFYETARDYYTKALQMDSMAGNYIDVALDYQVLGNMELEVGTTEDAIKYLAKSSYIFDTIPTDDAYYINAKYETYIYVADAYITCAEKNGDYSCADSCLAYIKKIGDYFANANYTNSQFSTLQCYARYLSFVGKDKDALAVLLECQKYLEEDLRDNFISGYYKQLMDVYKKLGDYKNALDASEKMHHYKVSSINDSTMNVVAKFEAEQEMKVHRAEAAVKQKQMRIIIFSLIGGLILVISLVVIIYIALKIKRKANVELTQKNHILDQQKSEIEAQRDEIWSQKNEIEAQKDIITQQWQAVEQVNNKLMSSINYAQRIQNAAISPKSEIDELFPDNFVYYKPRDIVGGDYYLVARCGRFRVMITADCTGHGIPGGFLSMLGISALKEFCVSEYDAANPGIVLDRMRNFVKATLVSDNSTIDDGMDMTICSYDFDAMEMRFAAANQVAILIRDGNATKLDGDRMPVGRYIAEKEHFKTQTIPIKKGDMIYTFSDGIQDQPGGETDGKFAHKFLVKKLVAFLTEVYDKPLDEQCALLDETITKWRGSRMQVDDITLIGVRV